MVAEPKVYCPKEGIEVSIWVCLGSFVQQLMTCSELLEAWVSIVENCAKVKCKAQEVNESV
ncbi:unnamed protein product [marine sediment metagenome]|uniref:Uncharacterized protein n=1 Tax=marine sediment metagenome TaxID=412755 RepID=X0URV5_9ZZZZ